MQCDHGDGLCVNVSAQTSPRCTRTERRALGSAMPDDKDKTNSVSSLSVKTFKFVCLCLSSPSHNCHCPIGGKKGHGLNHWIDTVAGLRPGWLQLTVFVVRQVAVVSKALASAGMRIRLQANTLCELAVVSAHVPADTATCQREHNNKHAPAMAVGCSNWVIQSTTTCVQCTTTLL